MYIRALYEKPYETPKWLQNKLTREGKTYPKTDYVCQPMPGGKTMISIKGGAIFPFEVKTDESGKQTLDWGEKHKLYFALKQMNLLDPEVIEKVRKVWVNKATLRCHMSFIDVCVFQYIVCLPGLIFVI